MNEEAEQPMQGLFQQETFGGGPHLRMVRALEIAEFEEFTTATALVRRIAFSTPHHELDAAKTRFWTSLRQAYAETSESPTVRIARATAALTDLFTVVASHHKAWREFVDDVLNTEPEPVTRASDRFEASSTRQLAGTLATAPDLKVEMVEGPFEDVEAQSEAEQVTLGITDWIADIDREAILVMDAAMSAMRIPLDDASRFLMQLAAEVLAGAPIVMPVASLEDGQIQLHQVDVTAARVAQSRLWQVNTFAEQIRQSLDESEDLPAHPGAPDDGEVAESPTGGKVEAGAGEPDDGNSGEGDEGMDGQEAAELSAVLPNLHRVLDALSQDVDDLASQWSRNFPTDSFLLAVAQGKEKASSFITPLEKSLAAEEHVAAEAGLSSNTLHDYPVALTAMSSWSSGDPAATLYGNQSMATITAFEKYIAALESVGKPQRMSITQGQVALIEFAPARAASLKAMGRLLAEVVEENVHTLANVSGRSIKEMGWSPTPDREVFQLLRSVKVAQSFGLPEASLLYARRLLVVLNASLGATDEQVLDAVHRELLRYVAGIGGSRGVALVLADGVATMVDEALRNHQEAKTQTLDDEATAEPADNEDD